MFRCPYCDREIKIKVEALPLEQQKAPGSPRGPTHSHAEAFLEFKRQMQERQMQERQLP